METLAEYVKRIMRERQLRAVDVQRTSDGRITDSYVASIVRRRSKNLTIGKLKALAEGLGVDEGEIFRVARQMELTGEMTPET